MRIYDEMDILKWTPFLLWWILNEDFLCAFKIEFSGFYILIKIYFCIIICNKITRIVKVIR